MTTDFLVELILSGHDVWLLEDEETSGNGLYQKPREPQILTQPLQENST